MKKILFLSIVFLLLAGCASGVYHIVKPDENLYRISRAYSVGQKRLERVNGIKDPSKIKVGDRIWIPGAARQAAVKKVRGSPRKTTKWTASNKKGTNNSKRTAPKRNYSNVKVKFTWPVRGDIISRFGMTNGELHDGIDISAGTGAEIKAAAEGKVIYSGGDIKSYGNMVIVKHAGVYSTIYAHNKKNVASKGSVVKAGEIIAYVGNSGRSNRSMLHFELREGKDAVDPLSYLPK